MLLDESGRDIWRDEFNATLQALVAVQDAYLGLLRQAYRMQRYVMKAGEQREAIKVAAGYDAESGIACILFQLACPPVNRWFRRNKTVAATLHADYQMQVLWIELAQEAAGQLGGVQFKKAALGVRFITDPRVDADAFDYTLKYLIDGLCAAGILASDGQEALVHFVRVEKGTPPRIEVVIWPWEKCPWLAEAERQWPGALRLASSD
jgi:hypothetical protein